MPVLQSGSPAGSPTVADVARLAGVSTATVSRVLNLPHRVAPATRTRVIAAVQRLGYVPNSAARRLAGAPTGTLGLVLPELSGPYFSELLSGVEQVSRAAGLHLLVSSTEALDPESDLLPSLPPADPAFVDGTIILPHSLASSHIDRLVRQGRPTVLVERTHPLLPTVSFDPALGVREAIRHLVLDHGARHVACLAGPTDAEASIRRERLWAQELVACGVEAAGRLVMHGHWSEEEGREMALALVASGHPFDAVFAVSDEVAIGALHGFEQAGVRVPEDVLLIGFDDSPTAAWTRPPLNTVAAPARELGRVAAAQLIAAIEGRAATREVLLPTTLVRRASCGCGASSADS